ncbi:MAG: ATP-dependent DNA helicase RecG [Actinomycetales bacterium]|nr:ATP-dependent DNA helicase RecG [Actinomycetales bacterium]
MVGDPTGEKLASALGGRTANALRKAFGYVTVGDLLWHLPRRYLQRGELTDLQKLQVGENVTVQAEVASVVNRRMQRRRGSILEVELTDGRSRITVTFFNQHWREKELRIGRSGLFAGQVNRYRGSLQLAHPRYHLFPDGVDDDQAAVQAFAGGIMPVYPASGPLTSWTIADAIRVLLDSLPEVPDPLPQSLLADEGLITRDAALRHIHRPKDLAEVDQARARLAFDEAFTLQLVLAQRRAQTLQHQAIPRASTGGRLLEQFDARLPFTLTSAQLAAGAEIARDLSAREPMQRLLQGDVGSGKTMVALRAMLQVIDAGGQAALLAPTEVLAVQHHRAITAMLGELAQGGRLGGAADATRVALLTGSQRTATRRQELLDITTGQAGIVIGTHALLSEQVQFHDLALVVVDEQHRFGVEQRAALVDKARTGTRPHVLVMTATPIPRTVAMTVFGDLDVTTMREMPAGRIPIATHLVPAQTRPDLLARAWERVREEVQAGHRVFVVCPRIGDGSDDEREFVDPADVGEADEDSQEAPDESPRAASVLQVTAELRQRLPDLHIDMLHGQMSAEDKDAVMRRFARVPTPREHAQGPDRDVQVLVSTTVIEVGVDVPQATMMVIVDADRFGISQLHQLRGRVGRGSEPGLCLLVTNADPQSLAGERLAAVAGTTDGFELAQLDLELRREGDVLGQVQSGRRSSLRLLEVLRDEALITRARVASQRLVAQDPDLQAYPALRAQVIAVAADDRSDYIEKS